jgi:hypothetical protein
MTGPRRGWTVWAEEIPATIMLSMPADLAKGTTNFLTALALEVGGAIDAGRTPPGDPMDDFAVRFALQIPGEPVLFEYVVLRDTREIRVPVLVWFD